LSTLILLLWIWACLCWVGLYDVQNGIANIVRVIAPFVFNPYPTNVVYIYGAPCEARNFNVVYIYGPMFGSAESRLFLFAAQCFNTESMQKVILWHSCV
jgi:hypothetical protein